MKNPSCRDLLYIRSTRTGWSTFIQYFERSKFFRESLCRGENQERTSTTNPCKFYILPLINILVSPYDATMIIIWRRVDEQTICFKKIYGLYGLNHQEQLRYHACDGLKNGHSESRAVFCFGRIPKKGNIGMLDFSELFFVFWCAFGTGLISWLKGIWCWKR